MGRSGGREPSRPGRTARRPVRAPTEGKIAVPTLSVTVPYVEYDETEAVCPQCGSAFRSPEVLEAHVKESHASPGADTAKKGTKRVRCSVCGEGFPSIGALQRHNRSAHVE